MKATINGMIYEGTPEEMMQMQQLQYINSHSKPFKSNTGWRTMNDYEQIVGGSLHNWKLKLLMKYKF